MTMAINKNALLRYQTLDKCFSNPVRKYFYDDLIEACNTALSLINPDTTGVKRRQIEEDIKYMEEKWDIPLSRIRDGKKIYFRYSDTKFSIDNQPLNQAEIEQIKSAMQILTRLEGMPQFSWVNELMSKLHQEFLLEKEAAPIMSFDSNQYLTGIEHLGRLFHSILYRQPLVIQYQSFRSTSSVVWILHPYYLKQYNNRWFLFGLNDVDSRLTNLALDRIISIDEASASFIPNEQYDFETYFEDIIGVTRLEGKEAVEIHLAFDYQTAPYILSKPLHGSQKVKSKDARELVISIEVIPNYELESCILAFGEKVQVIKPEAFRQVIKQRIEKATGLY